MMAGQPELDPWEAALRDIPKLCVVSGGLLPAVALRAIPNFGIASGVCDWFRAA